LTAPREVFANALWTMLTADLSRDELVWVDQVLAALEQEQGFAAAKGPAS
jgi:hypothetical protein